MSERNNRQHQRDSLFLLATLAIVGSEEQLRLRLRNLSSGGLQAETPVTMPRGTRILVNIRNIGWVRGTVVWAANNRLGIQFDNAIDARVARSPVAVDTGEVADLCVRRPPGLANYQPPRDLQNLRNGGRL